MLRVSGPHVDLKRVDVRRLNPFNLEASINARREPLRAITAVNNCESQG